MAFLLDDGLSQHLNLGLDLPWLNGASAATLMARVKPIRSQTGNSIISIAIGPPPGTSVNVRFGISFGAGALSVSGLVRALDGDGLATVTTANNALTVDLWKHVAIAFVGAAKFMHIYIDGVLSTSGATTATTAGSFSATNSKGGMIGAAPTAAAGSFMDGSIEDVRLYSRALSGDEISTISAGFGADGIYQSLQFRYLLNEQASGTPATVPSIAEFSRIEIVPVNSPVYVAGVVKSRSRQVRNSIIQF